MVLITRYIAGLFDQLLANHDTTVVDALMQPTKWTILAPADALILLGYHLYQNKERKKNFKYVAEQFCGINLHIGMENAIILYRADYVKNRRKSLYKRIEITAPKPWPTGWNHNTTLRLEQIFGINRKAVVNVTGFHDLDKTYQFDQFSKQQTA